MPCLRSGALLDEGCIASGGLHCLRKMVCLEKEDVAKEDDVARREQRCLEEEGVTRGGQRYLRLVLLEEDDIVHRAASQKMAALGLFGENTMALAMSSGFRRVPESAYGCQSQPIGR